MSEESMKELLDFIKLRREIPDTMFSVAKILENAKMEDYKRVCFDRIADALYIDGEHVLIDFTGVELDILVDKIGLVKCKDILLGYISQEVYDNYEEAIFILSEGVHEKNAILQTLKRFSKGCLLESVQESMASQEPDVKEAGILCRAELRARRSDNKAVKVVKEKVQNIHTYLKYRKIFDFAKNCVKEHEGEEDRYSVRRKRDWIAYYEALERFKEKQGEDFKPEELNKEEIQKYIYLVVNTNNCSHKIKGDVLTLEELCRCEDAIGLLTPKELQQLFPIQKEYDGARYQSKDYFFTMRKIEEHKDNTLIKDRGKGVFDFLWDYDNIGLSIYMIDCFSRMEKIYIAQGHKSFLEELFSKESKPMQEGGAL